MSSGFIQLQFKNFALFQISHIRSPFLISFIALLNIFSLFLCSAITLDIIRAKLDPINSDRYKDIKSFVEDVKLMFNNVYLFYRVSNSIYWTKSSPSQMKSNISFIHSTGGFKNLWKRSIFGQFLRRTTTEMVTWIRNKEKW